MYKVMLADDEPIMRKALVSLTNWKELDCQVVYTAVNGQDVLNHLEETKPDILVTDIQMPGKDGIYVAKYIWEKKLPIKVIILTAFADFSYAQLAIKYNVIEYVTKTGAFDELALSIEKCKELIRNERKKQDKTGVEAITENFLKAVFDGSLYDEQEIEQRYVQLGIPLENYLVLLFHFRMGDEIDSASRKRIHKSLYNFFNMAFGKQMIKGLFVQKDIFCVLLNQVEEDFTREVYEKCEQIIDMMDNFMDLFVYVGISERVSDVKKLKKAYEQADFVLGYSFLDGSRKINFYEAGLNTTEPVVASIDNGLDKVCREIQRGNTEEAVSEFKNMLVLQKQYGFKANTIKNSGILIQSKCRKMLAEYDKTIYDVLGDASSVTKRIYSCLHADEYETIMYEIIEKTARYLNTATNRKNALILECEHYIETCYEQNISVADIAARIGTSISYLSRIFKEVTGHTIIYTINQKKVDKAKEYLKNTDMRIYEVADALGFENTTYFSHFFKKHTGVSPKDFK